MSASDSKVEVLTVAEAGDPVRKTSSIFLQYVQPCLAELFGTSLFVFVGCSSVIGSDSIVRPALAHGLALVVLITVFGQVSGGHFNPAVSLSVCLCGGLRLPLLGLYVGAQMLGGLLGAGMTKVLFSETLYRQAQGAAFVTTAGGKLGPATVAEMILTMFLCTVVCMTAVNKSTRSHLAPLCIGLTVTAGIFAGGISGGCMNPARAFGPAVAAKSWSHHWVYWAGPVCGSLLASGLVRLLFGDQETRIILR